MLKQKLQLERTEQAVIGHQKVRLSRLDGEFLDKKVFTQSALAGSCLPRIHQEDPLFTRSYSREFRARATQELEAVSKVSGISLFDQFSCRASENFLLESLRIFFNS